MSKEKELQDELEKCWEQQDRIERMLKWLVFAFQTEFHFKSMTNEQKEKMENLVKLCPDISDILEKK